MTRDAFVESMMTLVHEDFRERHYTNIKVFDKKDKLLITTSDNGVYLYMGTHSQWFDLEDIEKIFTGSGGKLCINHGKNSQTLLDVELAPKGRK